MIRFQRQKLVLLYFHRTFHNNSGVRVIISLLIEHSLAHICDGIFVSDYYIIFIRQTCVHIINGTRKINKNINHQQLLKTHILKIDEKSPPLLSLNCIQGKRTANYVCVTSHFQNYIQDYSQSILTPWFHI